MEWSKTDFVPRTFVPNKMDQASLAPSSRFPTTTKWNQNQLNSLFTKCNTPNKRKLKNKMEETASAQTTSLPAKESQKTIKIEIQ